MPKAQPQAEQAFDQVVDWLEHEPRQRHAPGKQRLHVKRRLAACDDAFRASRITGGWIRSPDGPVGAHNDLDGMQISHSVQ